MVIGFGYLVTTALAQFTDIISLPGLKPPKNVHIKVMDIENFTDYGWGTLYTALFYFFIYFVIGGILEYTNPIPKTP